MAQLKSLMTTQLEKGDLFHMFLYVYQRVSQSLVDNLPSVLMQDLELKHQRYAVLSCTTVSKTNHH